MNRRWSPLPDDGDPPPRFGPYILLAIAFVILVANVSLYLLGWPA